MGQTKLAQAAQYGGRLFTETRDRVDLLVSTLESIGGSRALGLAIAIRYSVFTDGIIDFNPLDYNDPKTFSQAWQAHRLLAKCDFLETEVDTKRAAIDTFHKVESHCAAVNRKLRTRPLMGRAGRVFRLARKMIRDLLGDDPVPYLDDILDKAEWGGGSTSSCKGKWTSRANKIGSSADLSTSLVPFQVALRELHWYPLLPERVVNWNTVTTVPKSYKTDRTIAVEPTVNAALQRGVGKFLRDRLLRWGISTRDQTANQRLAKRGSLTGLYATLDLSSASDCVSQSLLEIILPPRWLKLLDTLRSPFYRFEDSAEGDMWLYHKHSSMGNGYTFELETLIFAAVARAATALYRPGSAISVYGDDIVSHVSVDPYIRGTLRALGFMINHEKSFRTTPFRESCGEEFFSGVRCTPYYARKWGDPFAAYTFANHIAAGHAHHWDMPWRTWARLIRAVPPALRLFGLPPLQGCFHSWDTDWGKVKRDSFGRPLFKVLTFISSTRALQGPAGVIESQIRSGEARGDPALPHIPIRYLSVDDTARKAGRTVLRWVPWEPSS